MRGGQISLPSLPETYDSPESHRAYWEIISRAEKGVHLPELRKPVAKEPQPAIPPQLLTVEELVEKYMERAKRYFRRADG